MFMPEYDVLEPALTCIEEITNHDYSDAPKWAVPRDWFIQGKYECEWEEI